VPKHVVPTYKKQRAHQNGRIVQESDLVTFPDIYYNDSSYQSLCTWGPEIYATCWNKMMMLIWNRRIKYWPINDSQTRAAVIFPSSTTTTTSELRHVTCKADLFNIHCWCISCQAQHCWRTSMNNTLGNRHTFVLYDIYY